MVSAATSTTLLDEVRASLRAARWRARSWSRTAAATTRLDEVGAFLRVARWRERSWSRTAAAATLLDEVRLLRVARWRAPSWSGTATATSLQDEVGAFLRAARWRVRSWRGTAAATTLLYEASAFLPATWWRARAGLRMLLPVISPDFSLELTGFFPSKHFIHFLVLKMKDFRNFVLDNCILTLNKFTSSLKSSISRIRKLQ